MTADELVDIRDRISVFEDRLDRVDSSLSDIETAQEEALGEGDVEGLIEEGLEREAEYNKEKYDKVYEAIPAIAELLEMFNMVLKHRTEAVKSKERINNLLRKVGEAI